MAKRTNGAIKALYRQENPEFKWGALAERQREYADKREKAPPYVRAKAILSLIDRLQSAGKTGLTLSKSEATAILDSLPSIHQFVELAENAPEVFDSSVFTVAVSGRGD